MKKAHEDWNKDWDIDDASVACIKPENLHVLRKPFFALVNISTSFEHSCTIIVHMPEISSCIIIVFILFCFLRNISL